MFEFVCIKLVLKRSCCSADKSLFNTSFSCVYLHVADVPVIVDDKWYSLKQDSILGVGMLNLFGLGRLLSFIENSLQALHQTAFHSPILWRRVTLQQTQQLTGQPRSWHKVVGVVLQVSGGWWHDLKKPKNNSFTSCFSVLKPVPVLSETIQTWLLHIDTRVKQQLTCTQ